MRGKDLYRTLMNMECANYNLRGKVLDLGSGINKASYHRFLKKSDDAEIISLDLGFNDNSNGSFIDLEKDKLPYEDNSIDTILAFNLLEHIYNYSFLISEVYRILKPGGQVIGAVPFLVGYHPDPRDFWRYTSESLDKIFKEHNYKDIKITVLGRGPMSAGYSQIEFMLPRIFKIIILQLVFLSDNIILKLKPKLNQQKFALGLFFSFSK